MDLSLRGFFGILLRDTKASISQRVSTIKFCLSLCTLDVEPLHEIKA